MSQEIIREVYFLGSSVLAGMIITFIYDFILIGRRIVRHRLFFVSLEDFFFWTVCAVTVFYMLYKENNGMLRWFAVFGAAIGMLFYKTVIGMHFVHMVSSVINKQIDLIRRIMTILFRPAKWLFYTIREIVTRLFRKIKKAVKYAKKKLTSRLKLLKIALCKH